MKVWKIAPGDKGYLWTEQRDNNCIAIGWNKVGNLKGKSDDAIKKRFKNKKVYSGSTPHQLLKFYRKVRKGDKIVASSGEHIFGIGTVIGNYKFNKNLEYKHSKPVRWEITFWSPLDVKEFPVEKKLKKRLGLNWTVLELWEDEPPERKSKKWGAILKFFDRTKNPFKNLTNWEGLPCAPRTEQEVIVLFSKLSNVLKMKIDYVGTRFPDAWIKVKKGSNWIIKAAEFEKKSSGFECHLKKLKEIRKEGENCDYIICWKDDWKRKPKGIKVIELRSELQKLL